jgi:hypothetical protein
MKFQVSRVAGTYQNDGLLSITAGQTTRQAIEVSGGRNLQGEY